MFQGLSLNNTGGTLFSENMNEEEFEKYYVILTILTQETVTEYETLNPVPSNSSSIGVRQLHLRTASALIENNPQLAKLKAEQGDIYIKETLDVDSKLASRLDVPVFDQEGQAAPYDDPYLRSIDEKIALNPRNLEWASLNLLITTAGRKLLTQIYKTTENVVFKNIDFTIEGDYDAFKYFYVDQEAERLSNILDMRGDELFDKYIEQNPNCTRAYETYHQINLAIQRKKYRESEIKRNEFSEQNIALKLGLLADEAKTHGLTPHIGNIKIHDQDIEALLFEPNNEGETIVKAYRGVKGYKNLFKQLTLCTKKNRPSNR